MGKSRDISFENYLNIILQITPSEDNSLIETRHDSEYISHIASSSQADNEELTVMEHSYHNVIMHNVRMFANTTKIILLNYDLLPVYP